MPYDFKDATMAHGDTFIPAKNLKKTPKSTRIPTREVYSSASNLSKHLKKHEPNHPSHSPTTTTTPHPLCDLVPFYGCDRPKSQVVITPDRQLGATPRGRPSVLRMPGVFTATGAPSLFRGGGAQSSCNVLQAVSGSCLGFGHCGDMKRRSYMDLHYARLGYPYAKGGVGGRKERGRGDMDTVRGICGKDTSRTNELLSMDTENGDLFEDAQSCLSETSSFYQKFIEKEELLNNLEDDCSDLTSVSQVSMVKIHTASSYSKKNKTVMCVPVLGSLGPDTVASKEKMNDLKKKQIYGQKASEQNKIRMMENKILQGLKSELKRSKSVDTEYLNKYITNCDQKQ